MTLKWKSIISGFCFWLPVLLGQWLMYGLMPGLGDTPGLNSEQEALKVIGQTNLKLLLELLIASALYYLIGRFYAFYAKTGLLVLILLSMLSMVYYSCGYYAAVT